jgi:hypothetical protein
LYFIDVRQVFSVLNNEPRFLSITPDTGLIDLHMIHDDLLPSTLKSEYRSVNTFLEQYIRGLRHAQDIVLDDRFVAIPLVTAVYFNPPSHIPSPPIHVLPDGTMITNFPNSLAIWAAVNDSDRTALYDEGCVHSSSDSSDNPCTNDVKHKALEAEQRFWMGIRRAIRLAEMVRSEQSHSVAETFVGVGLPNLKCQKLTRFGAGPTTVRVNTPFKMSQIMDVVSTMGYTIDVMSSRIVPSKGSAAATANMRVQTEL